MKKTILATAIALASAGAFASCGGGGCANANLPANAGAQAAVSGTASTYSTGNGDASSVMMHSSAIAGAGSISAGGGIGAAYCGNGAGAAGAGSIAGGFAVTQASGHVTGNGHGTNLAQANYNAHTSGAGSVDTRGVNIDATSAAQVSGESWSQVVDNGHAINGTASAAGSAAGGVGSTEYLQRSTTEYDRHWGWAGKRTVSGTETEGAKLGLGSISGAGSVSAGYVTGGGSGSSASSGSASSDVTGEANSRNGDANVVGTVGSDSFASSAATPVEGDYALSAAGSYNGAVAGGSADHSVTESVKYHHWLDRGTVQPGSEYALAKASDYKFGASDSYVRRDGEDYNGAEAGGNSNVDLTATAGDVQDQVHD